METTRPPTEISLSPSSDVNVTLLKSIKGTATLLSLRVPTFFTSKICSCKGKEKIIAGSSVDVKRRVKFGPKHAAATRPLGTVHLSAFHGVPTPIFHTLRDETKIVNNIIHTIFLYCNLAKEIYLLST